MHNPTKLLIVENGEGAFSVCGQNHLEGISRLQKSIKSSPMQLRNSTIVLEKPIFFIKFNEYFYSNSSRFA
jgi:hypothetical protein